MIKILIKAKINVIMLKELGYFLNRGAIFSKTRDDWNREWVMSSTRASMWSSKEAPQPSEWPRAFAASQGPPSTRINRVLFSNFNNVEKTICVQVQDKGMIMAWV